MEVQGPRIYLFDKVEGISTFDIIRHHKKHICLKKEKIGHFGTLDPFATGLVILGVGGATRLNEFVHELMPKSYYAKGKFGVRTDSGDRTGAIIDEKADLNFKIIEKKLNGLVDNFSGEYWQKPPAYSATKYQGKSLYEYAKAGTIIEKPPVKRFILQLEILSISEDEIEFKCTCSSGTYIRVLFEDMARFLFDSPIGHLRELRRLSYGSISLDHPALFKQEKYTPLKIDELLDFDGLILPEDRVKHFRNGLTSNQQQVISTRKGAINSPDLAWILDSDENLIGLADLDGQVIKPRMVFPANIGTK